MMLRQIIRIRRASALGSLESDECVHGYVCGFQGDGIPPEASFSFRHGWRNGMVDGGFRPLDEAQKELAHDVAESGYLKRYVKRASSQGRDVLW